MILAPFAKLTVGQEIAVVFTTSVGVQVLGLLSQSFLAWLLLPEGRGAFAVCILFASLLSILPVFSADWGAQYLVMARKLSVSEGLTLALGACLVASIGAVALALPLIESDLSFFGKADPVSFTLSLALVPLMSMSLATQLQLAGLRRVLALGVVLVLQSVVTVSGMAILVWALDMGVDGAIVACAAGQGVLLAGALYTLRRYCGLVFVLPSFAALRSVFGYGFRAHVMRIGVEIEHRIGVLALAVLASGADVAFFAAANAMVRSLGLIPETIRRVLLPQMTSGAVGRVETIGLCVRLVGLATAGAAVLLLVLSTPLVLVLLSEAFLPVVGLVWILAPGIFAGACATMFVTYFNSIDRPQVCGSGVWFGLAVTAAVFAVLFPMLGAESAAWAVSLGLVVRTVFLAVMFERVTGVTPRALWWPRVNDFVYLRAVVRAAVGLSRDSTSRER